MTGIAVSALFYFCSLSSSFVSLASIPKNDDRGDEKIYLFLSIVYF